MPNIWFSADYHFDHEAIIEYSDRPFSNADEMNEAIIERHNALVKRGDAVYFLGDFGMVYDADRIRAVRKRMNGQFQWIFGNHDVKALRKAADVFAWSGDLKRIRIDGIYVTLCHYAMRTWYRSHHGMWHLHGHSHGNLDNENGKYLSLDVGVDAWDYTPVEWQTVKDTLGALCVSWKPYETKAAMWDKNNAAMHFQEMIALGELPKALDDIPILPITEV